MSKVYIEQRILPQGLSALSHDIVHHMYARQLRGRIAIITPEPFSLMCVLRKYWLGLMRAIQLERARTLKAELIVELTLQLAYMRNLKFVTKSPQEVPLANVFMVSPAQINMLGHCYHTIYAVCPLDETKRSELENLLEKEGLLVVYE